MDKYTVLLVENQEATHKICNATFPANGAVRLLQARSLPEAFSLIDKNFIHIALVDINLSMTSEVKDTDGKGVLARLANDRPACRRYAYTIEPEKALKNFSVGSFPLAQGVIPKMHDWTEVEFIKEKSTEWLAHSVRVDGLDNVLAEIRRKMDPPHPLRDELDYLVSQIFGQGGIPSSIRSIELKLLDGGRSQSVVVLGQPKDGSDRPGIWTVIKFSSLRYARMEHEAYCNHVRFMLPVSHRVELLGYFEADTLGAMCYSFAGGDPQNDIASLERLILDEDHATFKYLSLLDEPLGANWYSLDGKFVDQAQYVVQRFKVDTDQVRERICTFGEKIAPALGAFPTRNGIRLGDQMIDWPTAEDVGHGQLRQRPRCIIHGDLHAGNILIRRDSEQTVLIDHQYTGPGPAYLDFASLDASPRVFTRMTQFDRHTVENQLVTEATTWNYAWNSPIEATIPAGVPFWARVSFTVVMLARKRFPDLSPKDYAGTCLLWALRLFKVEKLEEVPRVHLFIWISHLLKVLRSNS